MTAQAHTGGKDRSPEALFVALWQRAQHWGSERARAEKPSSSLRKTASAALAADSGDTAFADISALLPAVGDNSLDAMRIVLTVMRCIDYAFSPVHPRAVIFSKTAVTAPAWVRLAADRRLQTGSYWEGNGSRLLPRGPIRRMPRDETASSADSLADRFPMLAVAPTMAEHEGRPIRVVQKIIGLESGRGVQPGANGGSERIAFIPVGERRADFAVSQVNRDDVSFMNYRASATLDPAKAVATALAKAGLIDIGIAPELVMSEDHADLLPDYLIDCGANVRLLVAGTGHTREEKHDQAYNESQILNGQGTVLWRQRKLWPAAIASAATPNFGVTYSGTQSQLLEDNAAGDEIVLVDVESVGRCMVLICQDIETMDLAPSVISAYQPDWVFTPVLDPNISPGRWAHQRCFALSPASRARFLVASCTAFSQVVAGQQPACGIAVGPLKKDAQQDGRTFSLQRVDIGSAPGISVLEWHKTTWELTTVGAESPATATK